MHKNDTNWIRFYESLHMLRDIQNLALKISKKKKVICNLVPAFFVSVEYRFNCRNSNHGPLRKDHI